MSRMKASQYNRKCLRYDYDDAPGYESESDSSEFSDSEPSMQQTHKTRFEERKWKDQRIRPTCGIPARNLRNHPIDNISSTTYSSTVSSPLETTNETDPSDLYTPIDRNRGHVRGVIMEEEISPIHDSFAAPLPPSLHLNRVWHPQQTSTTTSLQPLFAVPRMGSGSGMVCSTPRSSVRRRPAPLTRYNDILNMPSGNERERPKSYMSEDSSLSFWDNTRAHSSRSIPETVNVGYYRPENYGMHAAYAKNKNIKGILFLSMSLCGSRLTVAVNKAVYFMESGPPICSYIRLQLRNRERRHHQRVESRKDDRKRLKTAHDTQWVTRADHRTDFVPNSNKPVFNNTFSFDINLDTRAHQCLFVSVSAMSAEHADLNFNKKRMLGCMTFHINKLLQKACGVNGGYFENENNMSMEEIVVNDGGFFLLDPKKGESTNMPQHKIQKQEFYNDRALSGASGYDMTNGSYSSSNLTSPSKLHMEEFMTASRAFGSSAIPGYSSVGDVGKLDYTSASSSANSRNSNAYAYHGMHRATLPSITTTSDTTTSDHDGYSGFGCPSQQRGPDHHFLYADPNGVAGGGTMKHHRETVRGISPKKEVSVRRAASFTFSPKGTVDKHNKRPAQLKEKEDDKEKRKLFGPISKTISYIRNKMDTALSTSSLYPSKDEVRQWETCFESLLNHKFGCSLFRQFLKKEFSDENVDFWLECEEFKRMKDGKKATTQRAHEIYKHYVAEQAPKEVNLDSDTRAATKAALESECKTDTFSLAQTRIEQLMEKDSYRRFLKDPLYQDLIKSMESNGVVNGSPADNSQ